MKRILFVIFALLLCTAASAQQEYMMNYGAGLGFGYSAKSGIALQGDIWLGNFYLGVGSDIGKTDNVIGQHYKTINPDESIVTEDRYSEGSYTGSSINGDIGYRLSNYLTLGATFGLYQNDEYINCFDEHHILGSNGYYYVTKTEDKKLGLGAFLMFHYPICKFAPYIRISYMTIAGASVRVGLSYHFQVSRSFNPYLY